MVRERTLRDRQVASDFVKAVRAGNAELLVQALDEIDRRYQWNEAIKAVAGSPRGAPHTFRERLLLLWLANGDSIRGAVSDDLLLIKALRAMLPVYTGPAVKLYRGETFWNRRRRTYGIAWRATAEIARDFAADPIHRTTKGGTVLIETVAPANAIICAPAHVNNRYGEQEYLVDRRRLRSVKVIERFAECSPFSTPIT
jgi:hypothetical protein